MKLCAAQIRPRGGDVQANIEQHVRCIDRAISCGANLIVFPELSLTGYEPTLAQDLVIDPDDARLSELQAISDSAQITIGVGAPTRGNSGICISMILFHPHGDKQIYSKEYIHADEEPFFVRGQNDTSFVNGEPTLALAIW